MPFLLIVVAGNGILTTTVKELVDRVRPALNPIAETLGPSFPSGHSSWSAAFFAAAALRPRARSRAGRPGSHRRGRSLAHRHGGRQPRAARRALAQRRDRGPGARLCMVLDVRHRIRWTPPRVRVDRRRDRPRCDAARHRRGPGGFAGRLGPLRTASRFVIAVSRRDDIVAWRRVSTTTTYRSSTSKCRAAGDSSEPLGGWLDPPKTLGSPAFPRRRGPAPRWRIAGVYPSPTILCACALYPTRRRRTPQLRRHFPGRRCAGSPTGAAAASQRLSDGSSRKPSRQLGQQTRSRTRWVTYRDTRPPTNAAAPQDAPRDLDWIQLLPGCARHRMPIRRTRRQPRPAAIPRKPFQRPDRRRLRLRLPPRPRVRTSKPLQLLERDRVDLPVTGHRAVSDSFSLWRLTWRSVGGKDGFRTVPYPRVAATVALSVAHAVALGGLGVSRRAGPGEPFSARGSDRLSVLSRCSRR